MSEKTILVWFRNDLRVHDNEILFEAIRKADKVLPVYCFDPHYFTVTAAGSLKTGNIRAGFLLESVADLRLNLQKLGGDLLIRTGHPADIIPQLAEEYHISEVYHHREVAFEETAISEQVEAALWKMKINLKHFIGHTLYNKEDLPFPIKDIPDSFATFRKKVERDSTVRACTPTPEQVPVPPLKDAGEIPSLADLGLTEPIPDERAAQRFEGGETAALQQLQLYFTSPALTGKGKGAAVPSRLSPWLAMGCVSLRRVYWEIMNHEYTSGSYPLMMELLWRDYFRFMFKKHGSRFHDAAGFAAEAPETADNHRELFEQWKAGATGMPFVDASIHELNATGYIANPSRQLVAAYLVKELKADWTLGAAWFEEKLIDYSPASNWGNWASIAGVGNDPRDNRNYNFKKLAHDLDLKGEYTRRWLPAVAKGDELQPAS